MEWKSILAARFFVREVALLLEHVFKKEQSSSPGDDRARGVAAG
jgi:hypothetical protein